jgi:hypothetical protein
MTLGDQISQFAATSRNPGGLQMLDPSRKQRQPSSLFQYIRTSLVELLYYLECYVVSYPFLLRMMFAVVRSVRPIAVFHKTVWVSKASDVREVLQRFDDFTLAEILGPKMPWGVPLLCLDWPEQHKSERQLLQSVVFASDDEKTIREIVTKKMRRPYRKKAAGRRDRRGH